MGWFKKSFKKLLKAPKKMSEGLDKLGISRSNTLRQLLNPQESGYRTAIESYEAGGTSGLRDAIKGGDITDPGGLFHKRGDTPQASTPPAAPTMSEAQYNVDTSRRRRRRGYLANVFGSMSSSNVGRSTLG
jgi:hypothetical protein